MQEIVFGAPDEDKISTRHIEGNNVTLRMQMRRFTGLTNAFSRKPDNHAVAISLHVAWYNLMRVYETLRTTPAMALSVADHVWAIGDWSSVRWSVPQGTPPSTPVMSPLATVLARHRGTQLGVILGEKAAGR
jgi:hypothetical protein